MALPARGASGAILAWTALMAAGCLPQTLCSARPAKFAPSWLAKGPQHQEASTDRPLIGIVSQAWLGDQSYIAASYAQFVERLLPLSQMAGGRPVPFFHDLTDEEIEERFKQVNGILLPGGGACLEPGCGYYDVSKKLLQLVMEANDNGETFPVQATCLGFEALVVAFNNDDNILESFDASNIPSTLQLLPAAHRSRFFRSFPHTLMDALETIPLTQENHHDGITPETFSANSKLSEMFEILTLSQDSNGVEYVSTVEAKQYPIFATQWHPEKNAFEWLPYQNQPHSLDAVWVTTYTAHNLVDLARRNSHKPVDYAAELELQIYNYPLVFTGLNSTQTAGESGFYQTYIFNNTHK